MEWEESKEEISYALKAEVVEKRRGKEEGGNKRREGV